MASGLLLHPGVLPRRPIRRGYDCPAASPTVASHAEQAIAWETGDVDAAFAKAKAENKPLFLYWGAVWCPPCNEVKATIFTRQDFIERARLFVPVYIDGDARGAQQQGARFNVSGYPTMVLFTPDGREITRLPGEVDADQYMRVLALGMNGARPVKETLAAALASGGDGEGRLAPGRLADARVLLVGPTDESQLVPEAKRAATLARLAKACPADQPAGRDATVAAGRSPRPRQRRTRSRATTRPRSTRSSPCSPNPDRAREHFRSRRRLRRRNRGQCDAARIGGTGAAQQAWNAALERLFADRSLPRSTG